MISFRTATYIPYTGFGPKPSSSIIATVLVTSSGARSYTASSRTSSSTRGRSSLRPARIVNVSFVSVVFISPISVDDIKPGIRNKSRRNANAIGALVVFEQGSDDARQCQRAAIEGMKQLRLPLSVFEAQLESIRLERLEVAHRAHFKPAFLCGSKHFEIITFGCIETHVATAEQQAPVRQLKRFQ